MTDNNWTNKKTAIAVGAFAACAAVGTILYKRSTGSNNVDQTAKKEEKQAPKLSPKEEENLKLAQEKKELGNTFFKNNKFLEAISAYTEAIQLTNVDPHFLYSNRAAAYTAMGAFKEAMEDSKKCIELKPEWSKGYFRLGKALYATGEISEAYVNFYRGLQLEPTSEELKKFCSQARDKLPPFGKRAHKFQIQAKLINLYLQTKGEEICAEHGMNYEDVRQKVLDAVGTNSLSKLFDDNEELAGAKHKDEPATLQLISLILIQIERGDLAVPLAKEALRIDYNNPQLMVITALALIRQNRQIFKDWNDAVEILNLIRDALLKRPDDGFTAHTYLGFVATLAQSIGTPDCPIDITSTLRELRVCLSNPHVEKLQIVHTGLQLWFKYFEDPSLNRRLYEEEQQSEREGLTPNQAYLKGLLTGAFHDLCMNSFFMQALSEVNLPFPQIERILGPFRGCILSLKPEQQSEFDKLSTFIYAIAIQSFKTNYLWDIKGDEQKQLDFYLKKINAALLDVNSAVKDGVLDKTLLHHISLVSMYCPLSEIENFEDLALRLDFSKLHPLFVILLNKSVLSASVEADIRDELVEFSPIQQTDLHAYYEAHVTPTWDNPPNSVLSKISWKQEFEWRYPSFKATNLTDKIRVLIAGCGTGKEVYQYFSSYTDVDITAVDYSKNQLAYAIRQTKELGVENVNFLWADILSLTPSHFNAQGLFDLVVVSDFLHYQPDPMKSWEKLTALVRPGGFMSVNLHNKRVITTLTNVRTYLTQHFIQKPVFDRSTPPRLLRVPDDEEVRDARRMILDALEQGQNQELADLIGTMSFYSLKEFRESVFNPQVQGFSYKIVGELLDRLGLKLVGFDFPEILYERELAYRAEHMDDPEMKNVTYLDDFDAKDPTAFAGHYISFTCQKPYKTM